MTDVWVKTRSGPTEGSVGEFGKEREKRIGKQVKSRQRKTETLLITMKSLLSL